MSTDFYGSNPKRLRSPLFDRLTKQSKEDTQNNSSNDILEKTLSNQINQKSINTLETLIKIGFIFIATSGGILSLLEFINVIRQIYTGNYYFGSSLIVFTVAFIGTCLSSIICLGFLHLIKTTRYIYEDIENQKEKIKRLLL